jgi:hypothetical protein
MARRLAAAAVLTAATTAGASAILGTSANLLLGGAWVLTVIFALFAPAWIAVQTLGGLVVAAKLLLATDGPAPLLMLPVVAGVVATTELLGAAARFRGPIQRRARGEFRAAARSATIGCAIFVAVVLVGRLDGPAGLLATGLASTACIALAILLVTPRSPDGD